MTRRPTFWIVFAVLGVAGFVAAVRLFPAAFPIITLDIAMDRDAAVAEAEALALRYGWDPPEARAAATFGQIDPEVQTYVELEGGGRDAFVELAESGIYHPYVWSVRRFAEGAVEESRVRFTPAGQAYGFSLQLSEDDPGGGNLSEEEARAVAERTAEEWGVDLGSFELLESSEETQPGGRVDHTFVFERTDAAPGDGGFRLRIEVAGNRASQLTHFVYVPEAFSQRYLDMRSANDAIALVSQSVFILVFVLLGGVVGTALLMRQGWVVWRTPLLWGGVTAVLLGLGIANALPLAWMAYDPAVSVRTFLLEQLAVAGVVAAVGTPLFAFFFLAGESLGRRAFPGHLQQWRFWSSEVAASTPALGRTVAAYLLLGIGLGYVVLFYLGTSLLEGWWSPAEALVQPDLLATFQPWLQAVSISLFAAFWEESVFRAVPIACAALLGARYGRKSVWIWGAVALQAIVFAAAHANYPQQPAYARVVELTFPAFLWGAIYLYFGLVPTILTHFTYDLSLISLPLFASAAPGTLFDRAMVVAVGVVPLVIVARARLGGRARAKAPEWAYNRAWTPQGRGPPGLEATAVGEPVVQAKGKPSEAAAASAGEVAAPVAEAIAPAGEGVARHGARSLQLLRRVAYVFGVAGALVWGAGVIRSVGDVPRLTQSRGEAIAVALDALEERGNPVGSWRALAAVPSNRGDDHRYVFEEAGEEVYAGLLGTYLAGPRWVVRSVDFAAAPEERLEEFRVHLGGALGAAAEPLHIEHVLPEARPGARLEEEVARAAALDVLQSRFGIDAGSLEDVGAVQTTRPARTDWEFTFEDPSVLAGEAGEARLTVQLAGDEVVDVSRSVSVPEEWERARRGGEALRTLVTAGAGLVLLLGFVAAGVLAVMAWAKRQLETRPLVQATLPALLALGLGQANSWPATTAVFSPTRPWGLQAGIAIFGGSLAVLVGSAAIGLVAALAHTWLADRPGGPAAPGAAVAVGSVLLGLGTAGELLSGGLPTWPEFSGAVSFVPPLAGALQATFAYLLVTTGLLLLSGLALRSRGRPRLSAALYIATLAGGLLLVPEPLQESLLTWAPAALLGAAVVFGLTRLGARAPALIPGIVATLIGAEFLAGLLAGAYPGVRVGSLVGLVVVASLAVWWTRELAVPQRDARATAR